MSGNPSKHLAIIGGMGPAAGARFFDMLTANTPATCDRDHLDVSLLSWPSKIEDRTRFLLGEASENPADAICEILDVVERLRADFACVPCITSHAEKIWSKLELHVREKQHSYRLLSLKEALKVWCASNLSHGDSIGIIATSGTVEADIFSELLGGSGISVKYPDPVVQSALVHTSIYATDWGIKSVNMDINQVRHSLFQAIDSVLDKGVSAIVLGCTELPLAIHERVYRDVKIIDPTEELAKQIVQLMK